MTREDQIADVLSNAFKARIADRSGISFEETGVSLPPREIWIYYAKAISGAVRIAEDKVLEHAAHGLDGISYPCAAYIRSLKHKEIT